MHVVPSAVPIQRLALRSLVHEADLLVRAARSKVELVDLEGDAVEPECPERKVEQRSIASVPKPWFQRL